VPRRGTRPEIAGLPCDARDGYCPVRPMKVRVLSLFVLLSPFIAGCSSIPMTYAEWKKEMDDRQAFARAGQEYKSPAQLRAEAAEMRQLADTTPFTRR